MTAIAQQRYRSRHPERAKAAQQKWIKANPERIAYLNHKAHAKARGIDFILSFEDWREWWGDDYVNRGRGKDDLCMCRYGDDGPYEIGNIYKATNQQNGRDQYD